jgi:hypothetical protein
MTQPHYRRYAAVLAGTAMLSLAACSNSDGTDTAATGPDNATSPSMSPSVSPSQSPTTSAGDPFALTRTAAGHMPMTADVLAGGFASATHMGGQVDSDASNLRSGLTYLLQEHVYLAGIAVDTAYVAGADSPEFTAAAAALDTNSVDLSKAVASVAGKAKGKTFLQSWRSHITDFVNYAVAAKSGDAEGKKDALSNLTAYSKVSGQFFSEITGGVLPAKAVQADFVMHIKTLSAAIDAFAAGDAKAFELLKMAADHMSGTAQVLATGIDKAASIKGDPNDDAASLRAALTDKLTAHVYLAGVGVFTAYTAGADSPEFTAAGAALDENSVEISQAVGSLAGSKQVEASFLQTWRSHIKDFVDYAVADASGDEAGKMSAQANLQAYSEAAGKNFDQLSGGALPAAAVQADFEHHIMTLSAAIDALAAALVS